MRIVGYTHYTALTAIRFESNANVSIVYNQMQIKTQHLHLQMNLHLSTNLVICSLFPVFPTQPSVDDNIDQGSLVTSNQTKP